MPKYSSINVPPKNVPPEPVHDYFERQTSSDIFTEWKYNTVIDNLIVLLQQLPPFYISGLNITFEYADPNENICVYSYSDGLVCCKGLVYMFGDYFQTQYDGIYVVRVSGSSGIIHAIDIDSYSYEYDLANNYCKIAYVCKGNVQYARQEMYSFLKDLPLTEARYNTMTYFGGYGVYQ